MRLRLSDSRGRGSLRASSHVLAKGMALVVVDHVLVLAVVGIIAVVENRRERPSGPLLTLLLVLVLALVAEQHGGIERCVACHA